MGELPSGTVTFLFSDIEGSTRMIQAIGDRWRAVLEEHNRLVRAAVRETGGVDVRTEGDAVFAVFRSAPSALGAAVAAQRALAAHSWPPDAEVRVRIGMHTGEGVVGGDDYVGLDVHRAARICSAAHGGQVLLSSATAELVPALTDGVALRDLGRHRLKDLARPERIFQVVVDGLPSEFPPIHSLEPPTNLPVPRTSFVARERETVRARELLRGPGLLTITGPGGTGKTRLAIHVARELVEDYADGAFFVELASISDPRIVPASIADAVGSRAEGGRPVLDTVRDHLRDLELLLVLDNFEQVLGAAPIVADLLDTSPRLRVLVTSREPLHIVGEQELHLSPLSVPEGDVDVADSEAVALFVQRASAVDPDFRLSESNARAVAELCRRLDGLPLAIELAACRTRLLSPQAVLDRLEHRFELLTGGPVDLPARQRTLREAIGWSHDLLDDEERTLFRRLAVFAGGWSLEAAEEVIPDRDDESAGVIDVLGSLVDKSLVTTLPGGGDGMRFSMLSTIREFAAERLDEAGEERDLRTRHAARFLSLAEAAEHHLRMADQKRWLDELELENDNVRSALRFAVDEGDADTSLRMVGALWRFWHFHGHLSEGRRWAEEALALPAASGRTGTRARALTALGSVTYWQSDVPAFTDAYEEAMDIVRELGDERAIAQATYNLAYARIYATETAAALSMLDDCRAAFERLGDQGGVADTMWFQGVLARLQGDLDRSAILAAESLAMHRDRGDLFGITDALFGVGRVAFGTGDLDTAAASFLEALDHEEQVGNRTGMGIALDNLAAQASARGDHLRAVRLAGASDVIKETAGGHAPPALIDLPDPRTAARPVLGESAVAAAWAEGRDMPLERALAYAREVA